MGLDLRGYGKGNKELRNSHLRIGYTNFAMLRLSLSHNISEEFRYHYGKPFTGMSPTEHNEHYNWFVNFAENEKDANKKNLIYILFFHSDCDGEWHRDEILVLKRWLEKNKPIKPSNEIGDFTKEYEKLLELVSNKFLQKIVFS